MRLQQYYRRLIAGVLIAVFTGVFTLWASAQLPDREDGHRPLRGNPAVTPPDAEPSESCVGYSDAPDFTVVPRIEELNHFPCSNCHAAMGVNRERRELRAPHPAGLDHGEGRLWCLDCHDADDRDRLMTSAGERVSFNRADQSCARCHSDVHRDWVFGAHG